MEIKVVQPFTDETGEHATGEQIACSSEYAKRLLFLGYVTKEKSVNHGKKQRKASENK